MGNAQWNEIKKCKRRESWGKYRAKNGSELSMIRGRGNKTWFENEQGKRIGPIQDNIAPAMCYATSRGWVHL